MTMKRSSLVLLGGGVALSVWALAREAAAARFSFAGKTVLITGGSRGLGLVMARQLAREKARLVLLARDREELARAEAQLVQLGAAVRTIACDLAEAEQIGTAVREAMAHFGGVDVLINNAGVIEVGPLEHMTRADFERSLAVHFWGPFELAMQLLPQMRQRGGGRIVNISSIGGKLGVPHLAPYCAGKFALTGFSDSIRAELARENIAVTTVAPGMMRTGSHVNARFKGEHAAEFAWFSFSNGLPLLSMAAERAAAKIIAAARRGQPSLTLTYAARLGVVGNASAPNLTAYAMKLANRFLPKPAGEAGNQLRTGWESRAGMGRAESSSLQAATARNNEQPSAA